MPILQLNFLLNLVTIVSSPSTTVNGLLLDIGLSLARRLWPAKAHWPDSILFMEYGANEQTFRLMVIPAAQRRHKCIARLYGRGGGRAGVGAFVILSHSVKHSASFISQRFSVSSFRSNRLIHAKVWLSLVKLLQIQILLTKILNNRSDFALLLRSLGEHVILRLVSPDRVVAVKCRIGL